MADLTAKGTIKLIEPTKVVGNQGFETRGLVITTDEQYQQTIEFQFQQGNVTKLDAFLPGQQCQVWFNLRGREWVNPQGETKVFNTLQGWNISHVAGQQQPQAGAPVQKYIHTATDATEAGYKQAGWTEAVLVQHGKGHFSVTTPPPPAAPVAAPPVNYPPAAPQQQAPPVTNYEGDLPF